MKTIWEDVSSGKELSASPTVLNHPEVWVPCFTTTEPSGGLVRENATTCTTNKNRALEIQTISTSSRDLKAASAFYTWTHWGTSWREDLQRISGAIRHLPRDRVFKQVSIMDRAGGRYWGNRRWNYRWDRFFRIRSKCSIVQRSTLGWSGCRAGIIRQSII